MTRIIFTFTFGDIWASPEDLAQMSDAELIELAKEDLLSVVEESTWRIERD